MKPTELSLSAQLERQAARLRPWRLLKDRLARQVISVGGVGVIFAVMLIFFYLFYEVFPLLRPASTEPVASYSLPAPQAGETLLLAMEEQAEIGLRLAASGEALFFDLANGELLHREPLPLPAERSITAVAEANPATGVFAVALDNGEVLLARHRYKVSFPDNQRLITPGIEYPLGSELLQVDSYGRPPLRLAVQTDGESYTLAAAYAGGEVKLLQLAQEASFLGDSVELVRTQGVGSFGLEPDFLVIEPEQRRLFVAETAGRLAQVDISDAATPETVELVELVAQGEVTALRLLAGGLSLLVGDSQGRVTQWFPVRDADNVERLTRIRSFAGEADAAITQIAPEFARKSFAAMDASGRLGVHYTTAARTVLDVDTGIGGGGHLALAPRGNRFLTEDTAGSLHLWTLDNEHPEVSLSALWGEVWYESYPEPDHIWQSSAATNDFEPKFSLAPLTFGTLKAAFYAMLVAVPLAVLGAIFTAYFMAPRMRQMVKPTIEIMEAMPTVIIGFLAGLWLAPFIESYLPGIFAALIIMPLGVILAAFLWQRLPAGLRAGVPDGWEAALLLPVLVLLGWFSMAISQPLELALFDGDIRIWLTQELGIPYDQRNSIVVGLAMGFAVIPTIFSIAEDAVFNVPKHLTAGSLALGATYWQTLTRVVLLTASPGIFSALMIGLGRAVGETMIVLMATGNTPIMDLSIFQGMRTLAANIAVEMPESEVGSTHYRVLFLAALVLFLFTFFVNTLAELVRQRLRRKYASL